MTASADGPVVTTAGYGDLKIGAPVAATTKLVKFYSEQCYDGRWSTPGTKPTTDPITVRTDGNTKRGKIVWISIDDPKIMTKSGAHVGSTQAELDALFPDGKTQSGNGALFVVSDSLGKVVFEFDAIGDEKPSAGVAEIHVIGPNDKPFSALHGDAFGPCYGA